MDRKRAQRRREAMNVAQGDSTPQEPGRERCREIASFERRCRLGAGHAEHHDFGTALAVPAAPSGPPPTADDEPSWPGWFSCPDCFGWFCDEGNTYDDGGTVCDSCAEKRDAEQSRGAASVPREPGPDSRHAEHKLDTLHRALIGENDDLRERLRYFLTAPRLADRIREHLDEAAAAAEAAAPGTERWMLDPHERTMIASMLGRALYEDLVLRGAVDHAAVPPPQCRCNACTQARDDLENSPMLGDVTAARRQLDAHAGAFCLHIRTSPEGTSYCTLAERTAVLEPPRLRLAAERVVTNAREGPAPNGDYEAYVTCPRDAYNALYEAVRALLLDSPTVGRDDVEGPGQEALVAIHTWLEKHIPPNDRRVYSLCPICGASWHATGLFSAENHRRECWVPLVNRVASSLPSKEERP
jgi:hypothetical protein